MSNAVQYRVAEPMVVYVSVSARDARSVTPIRLAVGTIVAADGHKLQIVRGTQTVPIALNAPDDPLGQPTSIEQKVQSGHLVPTEEGIVATDEAKKKKKVSLSLVGEKFTFHGRTWVITDDEVDPWVAKLVKGLRNDSIKVGEEISVSKVRFKKFFEFGDIVMSRRAELILYDPSLLESAADALVSQLLA